MRLTSKEQKVMNLLMAGKTDKEIARETGHSLGVVRNTVHIICGKMDAPNRTAAAVNYCRIVGFGDGGTD
jgi:DNA-binding NarL/FixJ family response regulator